MNSSYSESHPASSQTKTKTRVSLLVALAVVAMGGLIQLTLLARAPKQEPGASQISWQPNFNQELTPEAAQSLNQANRLYADGKYPDAYEAASKLTRIYPEEYRFHLLRGEIAFALAEMKEAIAAFDEVIRLEPSLKPSLWQRGLALYYADEFEKGIEQFETHQRVNSQDVENAVWHLLCAAKVEGLEKARARMIPIERDSRIPMAEVHKMFSGKLSPEDVLKAAQATSINSPEGSFAHKLQLYYAHLYIGLFQEMIGRSVESIDAMQKAEAVNPLRLNNLMGRIADVHLTLRNSQPDSEEQQP
jgi:lipoprotein NlpI